MRTMNYNIPTKQILLFCLFFAVACSEPEKPVTKEEAAKVATAITRAIARQDADRFNDLLDIDAIENRIRDQAGSKASRQLIGGATKTLRSGDYGKEIVRTVGNKGTYELVKQYEKDKHQHLIFRLYNDQLNYHDYELIKKRDQVKIADIFVYTTGENISTTLAETIRFADEHEAAANLPENTLANVQLMKKNIHEGNYETADSIFKSLPAVIRQQKVYKIIYIHIASELGNDRYLAALNKLQQEYPDAPNMYLLMIDAYLLKKDFDAAQKCVNRLDSFINKDPFLDYYRALICKQNMDNVNRMTYLERLHRNLPRFEIGTAELLFAYVEDEKWDKAVPLTLEYQKSKKADKEFLETLYLFYPNFKKKVDAAMKGQGQPSH